MEFHWPDFYKASKDRPPWPLVERAAELAGGGGYALDLGCGAGRDTLYLVAQGWHVTSVDREQEAINYLNAPAHPNLRAVCSSIEDFDFQLEAFNLISAQFSLPFVNRDYAQQTFTRLKAALKPSGIFSGQFFGVNDEWNTPDSSMTFLTRAEVESWLDGLIILELSEEEVDRPTALGVEKHWHVYHVLVQKPA